MLRKFAVIAFAAICLAICGCKATAPADTAPVDSATFDPDGTAHVTRIVPIPTTVSPEAQEYLTGLTKKSTAAQTLEERRAHPDEWRKMLFNDAAPAEIYTLAQHAALPV